MSSSGAALKAGLDQPLAALGVDVESVDVQKAGRRHVVRIVVDRDGGVDLDLVAAVSQRASQLLDEPPLADHLPGPFVLEVTSPGVDRPLTEPRHWRRALNRLVHVTLKDGSHVEGRITGVPADDSVTITTDRGDVTVAIGEVERAVVQVEFNRKDEVPGDDQVDAVLVDGDDDEDDEGEKE